MKKIIIILAILLMASTSWAAPFLSCDPPPVEEGIVLYRITEGLTNDYSPAHTDGSIRYDLAGVTTGQHEYQVSACNDLWGCGEATNFIFTRPVLNGPVGIGIIKGE